MLLIGALPQPITAAPLVFFVYLVLILLLGSAVASVLLPNTLFGIGAFAASMVLVALLYLAIAPFLLVAVQLLVFTSVSAALLVGLLRDTTGLKPSSVGRLSREWIIGAAVSAVMFALLALVLGATTWPLRASGAISESLGSTLLNTYVVGLAMLAVILGSGALGSGLLLVAPTVPFLKSGGSMTSRSSGGGGSRTVRR